MNSNQSGPVPTSVEQPLVPLVSATEPGKTLGSGMCGMWMLLLNSLLNINAIQDLDSDGLIPLSLAFEQSNESWATYFISALGKDQEQIEDDLNHNTIDPKDPWTPEEISDHITVDSQQTSIHNTMYNNQNTVWGGLTNGANQDASDTSQTIQLYLQMIQQGPQNLLQILTQVL